MPALSNQIRIRCPVAVVWTEIFGGTVSTLGRMARLAACRSLPTGRYCHRRIEEQVGPKEADYAMRIAHELLWRDWIGGSLEQEQVDILLYLQDLAKSAENLIKLWLRAIF